MKQQIILKDKKIINQNNIQKIIRDFEISGTDFQIDKRNIIKIFDINGFKINVKCFKKPNIIKKFIYKYLRKSKANRSFEYANLLIENKILTPNPIAFAEQFDSFGLTASFYFSEHLENVKTIGAVFCDNFYPNKEKIIRGFTENNFKMHEAKIEFLDNSPGNTLVFEDNDFYKYYIVDLNRMNVNKELSFEKRMKNLSRFSLDRTILKIISNEYSKLYNKKSENEIFSILEQHTMIFHQNLAMKRNFLKLNWLNIKDLNALNR